MPELSITPAVSISQAPARGGDARVASTEPTEDGLAVGAATPFSALLKSMIGEMPTDTATTTAAKPAATVEVTDLINSKASLKESLGGSLPTLVIPGITGMPGISETEAKVAKADEPDTELSAPMPPGNPASILPLLLQADTVAHPGLALKNPAGAVSPTPTFPDGGPFTAKNNLAEPQRGLANDLAGEKRITPATLAVKAAISAEATSKNSPIATMDQTGESFSAIMEHMANHPAAATVPAPSTGIASPHLRVETPLGQPGWHDEVGQKLTWIISSNRQQADLVLNPPQLGRIEVTLTLDGGQTSASFTSPHPAVRDALENALPHLREVLADAGVTLGQTHVGADARRDPNAMSNPMHPKNDGIASLRNGDESYKTSDTGSRPHPANGRGIVDVFA